jgi:hypothetical protein
MAPGRKYPLAALSWAAKAAEVGRAARGARFSPHRAHPTLSTPMRVGIDYTENNSVELCPLAPPFLVANQRNSLRCAIDTVYPEWTSRGEGAVLPTFIEDLRALVRRRGIEQIENAGPIRVFVLERDDDLAIVLALLTFSMSS